MNPPVTNGLSAAPRPPNRLAGSASPYLLQHAHNPVDWWPWGDAAIEEARRRDVPIFLSVGYSTCYWCHVMERESFEDEATARVLNERFVSIKVDREEHSDVDGVYMAAVQMLTGSGGWPMSVFLDPQTLHPFWGGTYFPPVPAHGRPSFTQVLERLSTAYRERREEVRSQGRAVAKEVESHVGSTPPPARVGLDQVTRALQTLLTIHDRTHGGFGGGGSGPKFPQAAYLKFLIDLRRHAAENDTMVAIDQALRLTLDRMAVGGLFDQVGGGFHRYSVDGQWIVPHFEKMLYDQAQLLEVYAGAAVLYDDPFYALVARRTGGYVLREMTGADGAFFTAQDAEVNGREGLNYVWTPEEVSAALAPADAEAALDLYGVKDGPNFQDPHHPREPARSVLHLRERPEALAKRRGTTARELVADLDRINTGLYAARGRRPQPRLDDKVISGWNGLMIQGLARAGVLLGEASFVEGAARAAEAVLSAMRVGNGNASEGSPLAPSGLRRTLRAGQTGTPAALEDYAAMIGALAALARSRPGERERWLSAAQELVEEAERALGDGAGGFFDARAGRARPSDLFVRTRSTYDGAIPSGTSLMLNALLDLHAAGAGEKTDASGAARPAGVLERAQRLLVRVSGAIADSPISTVNSTRALLRLLAVEEVGAGGAGGSGGARSAAASLDALLRSAGAVPARPTATLDPVEILASEESLTLSEGEPVELLVRLVIAEGYHINAAGAGEQSGGVVEPLRLSITGGAGVSVYADYPEGEPLAGAAHRVHSGEVDLRVALERTGPITGEPRIAVSYQACTDRACLQPVTAVLGVEIVGD